MDIRNESVNRTQFSFVGQNFSWIEQVGHRFDHDDNQQETSETKTEVFALKTEVFAFANRSKAKAKTEETFH